MSNFTKGEWKVYGDWGINTGDSTECHATFENYGDAHLIAAAPAMYKLLEKFLPMDGDGNGWDFVYDEGSEHMGEEVIALLSKARGES